jgi:preprotein translocase subunit SecG
MFGVVIALHLLVCLGLVSVILVQSGKGGGLAGGAFGAQAQTVFGGRGATDFITRATIALGVLFFLTSFSLALMTSHGGSAGGGKSLLQEQARKAASAPAPTQVPTSRTPSAPAPANGGGSAPSATPAPATAPTGGSAPPPTKR